MNSMTAGFMKVNAQGAVVMDTNTYLTGVTSGQVTGALGYTPYNSSNPSGYVTSSNWAILSGATSYNTDRTTKVSNGLAIYSAYSGGANSPTTYDISAQYVVAGKGMEMAASWHSPSATMFFRTLRDCCDNWSSWVTMLSSANFNSYALPLTGGTLSGNLYVTNSSTVGAIFLSGAQSGARQYMIQNGITGISNSGLQIRDVTGNASLVYFDTSYNASFGAGIWATSGNFSAAISASNISSGVNASHIVQRDGNGYIYANHINFNTPESENPAISSFITSNGDGWSRKSSLAHVRNQLGNYGGWITGYTETDTLASVTARGASTTGAINVNGDLGVGNGTTSINQAIRLGGDNAAGGRLYFQYAGDSSYIDSYGGHGGGQRYRDLQIVARNLNLTSSGGTVNANGSQVVTNNGGTWSISITGNAGSVSGLTLNSINSAINPNNVTQNQIGYNTSVNLFGQTDGGLYSSAYSSDWIHQIYGDFRSGQIAIRGKQAGTWQAWRTVLDSGNYNSYSPTLTGGNASGTWGISITGNAQSSTTTTHLSSRTDGAWYNVIWGAGSPSYLYSSDSVRILSSEGALRANIYYDNQDTAYYLNPAGGSRLRNLYVGDSGDDWSDPGGWGTQVRFSNIPHVRFVLHARSPGIEAGMYVHTPGSVFIGSYTGHDVSMMWAGSRRMQIANSYIYTDVYLEAAGSMRAPIFYDSNDTGYYLDLNSTSDSAMRIRGGALFGPNPTWGAYLQVGGNGNQNTAYASVVATNGNLHLDSAAGYAMYLNNYANGIIYLNGGTYYISSNGSYYNGRSEQVTINYNNDSNSTYQLLWGSGNSVYGTAQVYVNPSSDIIYARGGYISPGNAWGTGDSAFFPNGITTAGGTNWVYGTTYIGNAPGNGAGHEFFASGSSNSTGDVSAYGSMRAPIFYDRNDTNYYLDPNGTSNLQTWTVDTASRLGRSRYWTNRWAIYGVANDHMTGTNGWAMDHGGWDQAWKGGFSGWDIWGGSTGHPQGSGYVHAQGIISGQHAAASDGSTAYGWMMVGAHNATENRYWLRGKWGSSTSGWVEMITTGNIGSQSVNYAASAGNANTVGGLSAGALITTGNITSQAVTSLISTHFINQRGSYGSWNADFNNTPAGTMTHGGDLGANGSNGPGGSWWMQQNFRHTNSSNSWGIQVAWGWEDNANRLATRNITGGSFGGWVYYINSNNLTSYMDAPNKAGTSYYQTNTWMQMNGTHGIYWPSYYGAHLYVNTTTSYTQFRWDGQKNGYDGVWLSYSAVNGMMYDSGGNGGVYREANGLWYFYYNIGNNCMGVGTSTTSSSYKMYVSGTVYATGDVIAYSDRRKKTNIETIKNALEKVTSLRGVFYDKIGEETKGRQLGVIAQEVDQVLPEAVSYAKDIDEYGVKYGNMVGVLIEAIKEQQKQIEDLKSIISGITK
jgi:hypothetical protein